MGAFFRSSSGYFQYDKVGPLSKHHLRCQAPNPDTSSNIVRNPLCSTATESSHETYICNRPSNGDCGSTYKALIKNLRFASNNSY